MTTHPELVGSLNLIVVDKDGRESSIVVGVGVPERQPTGEWACPTLTHDHRALHAIYGQDSLQALGLGLSFIRLRLEDHLEQGGRLLLPEGRQEVTVRDLAAWFSGVGVPPARASKRALRARPRR